MLKKLGDLKERIGHFAFPNIWPEILGDANQVLDEYYGSTPAADLYPHLEEPLLRKSLLQRALGLKQLVGEIRIRLEYDYCALIFEKLHLDEYSLDTRRRLLYCFSLALGVPTPTDKIDNRILWDVKARTKPVDYVTTISENNYEAELHTDTQYYPNPEKYTFLYVVHPARCGGGASLLLDGVRAKQRLLETPEGKWALEHLSRHEMPFRIPTTYTKSGKQGDVEITYAPIFTDNILIRYRKDTLEAGLKACPAYDTPENRRAISILQSVLEDPREITAITLAADSMLLTNNHQGLHGRTSFEDQNRLLIRVRIDSERSNHRSHNESTQLSSMA